MIIVCCTYDSEGSFCTNFHGHNFSFIMFQDFFGKPAFLTVSGQLNAETYATALSDVYSSYHAGSHLTFSLHETSKFFDINLTPSGVYIWSHIPG